MCIRDSRCPVHLEIRVEQRVLDLGESHAVEAINLEDGLRSDVLDALRAQKYTTIRLSLIHI